MNKLQQIRDEQNAAVKSEAEMILDLAQLDALALDEKMAAAHLAEYDALVAQYPAAASHERAARIKSSLAEFSAMLRKAP